MGSTVLNLAAMFGTSHDRNMASHKFTFHGHILEARGDGALFWPAQNILVVSDLHLGKSERIARRGGSLLPPYETEDTLGRLDTAINQTNPAQVLCLGDSFDDLTAADHLNERHQTWITRLQAGRLWTWIEGNHDAGGTAFGGTHLAELKRDRVTFTHIATPKNGEVSGHYHPKATINLRGRVVTRPAFLYDERHLILPSFGTYTGGLNTTDPALRKLFTNTARAILTGSAPIEIPMPRKVVKR
jgi:DNA ligase-associated metallophosphoesterase